MWLLLLIAFAARYRVTIQRDFATWDFSAWNLLLAAYLGTSEAFLVQAFPPLEGSVIAFLDHEEMTDKGALYDVAWSGIVNATGLDVSDVRRIDLLFVPDHTMQRSPTSAPQATTERMNLAPSPTGS